MTNNRLNSETDTCRDILAGYCVGLGIDIGFGGSAIVPHALTFDLQHRYGAAGRDLQIMQGNCRDLGMFCDEVLDYIFSSHLLEDFSYSDLIEILEGWRRVLKIGGMLIINCPDQQKYLAHCNKTGQPINCAHHEATFGLDTFKKVLKSSGAWKTVFCKPDHGPYSWLLVEQKV